MTYLDSIILGVVEGLSEFLPISSTGHLILVSGLLGLTQTEFLKSFEIVIQLGAIAAVLFAYWRSFLDIQILKRLAVAFIPTAVVGYALYHFIKSYLIGNQLIVVVALFLGGIAILIIEYAVKDREKNDGLVTDITYTQSALIGLAQALAIIPGVSRSGATVMGGLLMNIPRTVILTFSFLLAVPTMLAATAYDILKNPDVLSGGNFGLLAVGFVTAFFVALLVIKFALSFVRKYSFVPFALYRIALALLFWFVIF